jgi:putative phage-type endonuclease
MTIEYFYDIEQGSDEWHALRCGVLTASEMKNILTPTKKIANNDKTRAHVYEIAAQRITNYVEPQYISDDMLRGKQDEIKAIDIYSQNYSDVLDCAFVKNKEYGVLIGYSPDGLVGDDGLIEIKSRLQKYQIETIAKNQVPDDYMLQLQTGLLVTGRKWIDFISYSSGLPMFVQRVFPDKEYFDAIIEASKEFEGKVLGVMAEYNKNKQVFVETERDETDLDIL